MQKTLLKSLNKEARKSKRSKNAILHEALRLFMKKKALNNVLLSDYLKEL